MANIKNVQVHAIYYNPYQHGYYWNTVNFKTFIDDNGNKTFYINDKEVDGEAGNERFLEIWRSHEEWKKTVGREKFLKCKKVGTDTFEVKVFEEEVTYEELITRCEKAIDNYVDYIEDYKQYKDAVASNAKLYKEIEKYRKLIAERRG